jgi:hypothetical protein
MNEEVKTKEKFTPVIFISEYRGLTVMDEAGKIICRFSPFMTMHPKRGEISKGHYLCTKRSVFNKLTEVDEDGRSKYGFNKIFKITKKLLLRTDKFGNVMRGVATAGANQKGVMDMNEEERGMLRLLGQLQAKYFTEDSNYLVFKGNVKESAQNRVNSQMNEIKNKLGIS